ncbi:hypothetical protein COV49_01920 [Candidatus Falkowbacteria bacterium CG11_big_fil_rev_8_21_14_0_20_39_10]|uniref:Uncharacterized protein n=1 Tax=Candidatus Falkowbacteria bacterium CG11_big_fil_rev_8_21_14_0_20_39_10 TaxID=1974570 RepID=A0A2M6K9F6_9BACT|nr:MAG: hypothetical protein COV49_01920 [Candidatus Falkowbacteria bacterium CG11_big_fil_rev_8_21_14_0_20_39_10]
MALTKRDLESVKSIVKNIIVDSINASETKMMQHIDSQFRIQNIVLDTKFRAIDTRFDSLENQMSKGFEILKNHESKIEVLKKRMDII